MDSEFFNQIQRLVETKGERFAREYIRVYCGVVLDDPDVPDYTKEKIRKVVEFLDNETN